jgi:peptidoglycan/xylan/chitin deacetylase (PgdA/CDA1 family)
MKYAKQLMIAAVVLAVAGAGAYVALRPSPVAAPGAAAVVAGPVPQVLPELHNMLAAYRKIIVLFADEKKLSETDRKAAEQVGQALFHENLERLAGVQKMLERTLALPQSQRDAADDALLSYIESAGDLFDADRLAFREVLITLQKLAAADQTLPAIKLHKRVSEDLSALEDIEKQYDKELNGIFARFEARAIVPKRERWDDYVAHLRKLLSRDQIMKDYGVIVPYPEPPKTVEQEEQGKEIFGTGLPSKTVVLTFDDGPHGTYTEEVAAILKQYNVPGVFFQVGQNVGRLDAQGKQTLGKNAAESRRLIDAGHTVGNHSFSHAQLSRQKGDALYGEIANADEMLKAADPRRSDLFRFPYGARNAEGMAMLSKLGLRSVMWNIDSLDWADPVPSSIANRVLTTLNKEQRGIILFHDIHERSVKALPMVLDKLIADGYSFAVGTAACVQGGGGQPAGTRENRRQHRVCE